MQEKSPVAGRGQKRRTGFFFVDIVGKACNTEVVKTAGTIAGAVYNNGKMTNPHFRT